MELVPHPQDDSPDPPADQHLPASNGAEPAPRVASLHLLMREIGSLRRQLETDLSLTAAALEQDELAVADDMLASSVREVGGFERRSQVLLGTREVWPEPVTITRNRPRPASRARELAVAAAVGAFAVVALASPASQGGVVLASDVPPQDRELLVIAAPVQVDPQITVLTETFSQSVEELDALASSPVAPEPTRIREVADNLATSVQALTEAQPSQNDGLRALLVLQRERQLLDEHNEDDSLTDLVQRNESLTKTLSQTLLALATDVENDAGGILTNLTGTVDGVLNPPVD